MLMRLAQMAGGALMYGWALWFVAALAVGALLLARDELRFWWAARQTHRRKHEERDDTR